MLELTFQIILIISLGGVALVVTHKIPALVKLSEDVPKKPAYRRKQVARKIKTSASSVKQRVSELKAAKRENFREGKGQKRHQVDSDSDYWEKVRQE